MTFYDLYVLWKQGDLTSREYIDRCREINREERHAARTRLVPPPRAPQADVDPPEGA